MRHIFIALFYCFVNCFYTDIYRAELLLHHHQRGVYGAIILIKNFNYYSILLNYNSIIFISNKNLRKWVSFDMHIIIVFTIRIQREWIMTLTLTGSCRVTCASQCFPVGYIKLSDSSDQNPYIELKFFWTKEYTIFLCFLIKWM